MSTVFEVQPTVAGDSRTFTLYARRNGATWDLSDPSAATVTLYLHAPDGTVTSHVATVTDAPGGVAERTVAAGVIDVAGNWLHHWKVEQASVVRRSRKIGFVVVAAEES